MRFDINIIDDVVCLFSFVYFIGDSVIKFIISKLVYKMVRVGII